MPINSERMTMQLLPIPHSRNLGMPHLLLQLKDPIHQCFASRRTSRDVNINRHYPVATPGNRVAVMIISTAICAAAHANDPSWIWHLIVDLSQRRCHFVCESACYNHDVRLSRRSAENDAESILVVSRCGEVHHFDGAAGETEGHGPE